jgi:hypothetical protein
MGNDYETRLIAFAEGKRLARLSKVVRERGVCDACGSTLPHLLFGLRETVSGRHYFLGQNCLALLLERRLVARARYRQSAEVAYRHEMELRSQEANVGDAAPRQTATSVLTTSAATEVNGNKPSQTVGLPDNGARAQEQRPQFQWVREGGALVLQRTPEAAPREIEAFLRSNAFMAALDHFLTEGRAPVSKKARG